MTKDCLILVRDYFQSSGLQLFVNNTLLYSEKSKFTTLVWDDANELVYCFRPNQSAYDQDVKRMVVDANDYDNVQTLITKVTRDEMVTLLTTLKSSGVVTDDIEKEILLSYDSLNNKLL